MQFETDQRSDLVASMNRPDWLPRGRPHFTCRRMDLPQKRVEKSGTGILMCLIALLLFLVGVITWALWGAV